MAGDPLPGRVQLLEEAGVGVGSIGQQSQLPVVHAVGPVDADQLAVHPAQRRQPLHLTVHLGRPLLMTQELLPVHRQPEPGRGPTTVMQQEPVFDVVHQRSPGDQQESASRQRAGSFMRSSSPTMNRGSRSQ